MHLYTHTIPWALHGKVAAKQAYSTKTSLFGDHLDRAVRGGQSGQTMGLPVSPDTSLMLAETILSALDIELHRHLPSQVFRYMDDYEISCATYADALQALATIQGVLSDYSLSLNPNKSRVLELPEPIERPWVDEISHFLFRHHDQAKSAVFLFSKAFEIYKDAPDDRVVRYAIGRLRGEVVQPPNWPTVLGLLLQAATSVPGCLPAVVHEIHAYLAAGYKMDKDHISQCVESVVLTHAPQQHGAEVTWAIWLTILTKTPLSPKASALVATMHDPFVALVTLKAKDLGLVHQRFSPSVWATNMTRQDLSGKWWPLAYEAMVQGWLPSAESTSHVSAHPTYSVLESDNVRFFVWRGPNPPSPRYPLADRSEGLDWEEEYGAEALVHRVEVPDF